MKRAASLSPIALFILACSSGSGSEAQAFIDQLCDRFMPCCAKAGKSTNGAQCRAFYGAFTSASQYDAAAGKACLAELDAASGRPEFCASGLGSNVGPSCKLAFRKGASGGVKKPGETCSNDDECAASPEGAVECETKFIRDATIKKCQLRIDGKAGDGPCVGTRDGSVTSYSGPSSEDIVPRGYICDVAAGIRCDSTQGKCVALSKIGDPCTSFDASCTKDAYCESGTRRCAARKGAGAPCASSGDECGPGLYCPSATKVCTAAIPDGGACSSGTECVSSSCVNKKCSAGGSGDLGSALLCGG